MAKGLEPAHQYIPSSLSVIHSSRPGSSMRKAPVSEYNKPVPPSSDRRHAS
ncbi:Hypothetical predicted protein, partial [Pelobates cultripes]